MINSLFNDVLILSVKSSLIITIILIIRAIIGQKLTKNFTYYLWSIVLISLLVPLKVPSKYSIFNLLNFYSKDKYLNIENALTVFNNNKTYSRALNSSSSVSILSVIYIVICLFIIVVSLIYYIKISKILNEAYIVKDKYSVKSFLKKLKIKRSINIYCSSHITTPVVFGYIKPKIIIPYYMYDQYDIFELEGILFHELIHIKRYDYIIKPLFYLAACIHWYNPLVWISYFSANNDMELSCDETTLSLLPTNRRNDYANKLLKVSSYDNKFSKLIYTSFGDSNIKNRINKILNYKKTTITKKLFGFTLLILMAIMLLTTSVNNSGMFTSSKLNGVNDHDIIRELSSYDLNKLHMNSNSIYENSNDDGYTGLGNALIEVYNIEYQLQPKDLQKLIIIGVKAYEEWSIESSEQDRPSQIVKNQAYGNKLMGIPWSSIYDKQGSFEKIITSLLNRSQ